MNFKKLLQAVGKGINETEDEYRLRIKRIHRGRAHGKSYRDIYAKHAISRIKVFNSPLGGTHQLAKISHILCTKFHPDYSMELIDGGIEFIYAIDKINRGEYAFDFKSVTDNFLKGLEKRMRYYSEY